VGKKIEPREEKGCVKIWELDRNNSNVKQGSSNESDDKSLDSLMCSCSAEQFLFVFFQQPL